MRRKQRRLGDCGRQPENPAELLAAVPAKLESSKVPFLFAPNEGPPAYPAMIEAADEIYVTADSVAMVADAVNERQAGRNHADREKRLRAGGDGNHGP